MKPFDYPVFEKFAFRHIAPIQRLRCPADVRLASRLKGANCGPASYAAAFERDVLEVMSRFPQFPKRPYTTTAQMEDAFEADGILTERLDQEFPADGVALLQFIGPWGDETTNSSAALKRTHWVGVKGELIYDLNWGAWLPLLSWEAVVFPMFADFEPRISGWRVRCGLEISDGKTATAKGRAKARIALSAMGW